jgi:methyl-accepting chemotaxis protein
MKLGIRTKLLSAFAVVMLLAAIVGITGILNLSKVNDLAVLVYDEPFTFDSNLSAASARLADIDSQVQHELLDTSEANRGKFRSAIQADSDEIDRLLALNTVNAEGTSRNQTWGAFPSNWKHYQEAIASVNNAIDNKDATGASRLYFEQTIPSFEQSTNDLTELAQTDNDEATSLDTQIDATYSSTMTLMIIMLVIAFLVGGGISFFLSTRIAKSLKRVVVATDGLAKGELDQTIDINSKDELGDMADGLRRMIAYQNQMAGIAEAIARGELADSVQPQSSRDVFGNAFQRTVAYQNNMAKVADVIAAGDLSLVIQPQSSKDVFGNAFQRMISYQTDMARVADSISAGDLSMVVHPQSSKDVFGNAFQRMLVNLRKMVSDLVEAANVLAASASEIMATTSQVAAGAAETATAVTQTTATVEEVKQTAQLSSEKARSVSDSANRSVEVSQVGTRAVDDAIAGMERIRHQMEAVADSIMRLSEQRQAIGEIITTVSDLAEQSNLLAVNAAIEAAKAGDQGRGFAVVAQEVKRLAEQSKQATAQVRGILNDIEKATTAAVMATEQGNKAVETGARQSEGAGQSIRSLADSIGEATQAATQIAASSQQQLIGMDQIVMAMESIKQASVQNVVSTKQAAVSAQSLHELGQKLKVMVAQYQV